MSLSRSPTEITTNFVENKKLNKIWWRPDVPAETMYLLRNSIMVSYNPIQYLYCVWWVVSMVRYNISTSCHHPASYHQDLPGSITLPLPATTMTSLSPRTAHTAPRPRLTGTLNLIPLILVVFEINPTTSFLPFLVGLGTRNAHHKSAPVHQRVTCLASSSKDTGSSSSRLPFFAAPASFTASPPSSSSTPQSSTRWGVWEESWEKTLQVGFFSASSVSLFESTLRHFADRIQLSCKCTRHPYAQNLVRRTYDILVYVFDPSILAAKMCLFMSDWCDISMHELLDVSCLPNFTAQLHLNLYLLFTLWALKKHYTIQQQRSNRH